MYEENGAQGCKATRESVGMDVRDGLGLEMSMEFSIRFRHRTHPYKGILILIPMMSIKLLPYIPFGYQVPIHPI
jgi:hypothetical protein